MIYETAQMTLLRQLNDEAEQARTEGKLVNAAAACDMIDALIIKTRSQQIQESHGKITENSFKNINISI